MHYSSSSVGHNSPVSATFPRTRKSKRGYSIAEVEDFLELARAAYTAGGSAPAAVDAASIRTMAFSLERGGYSPQYVDAALERLEDAFATREREAAFARPGGDAAWYGNARTTAQEILDRIDRNYGQRFNRVGPLSLGYHPRDVDAFTDRLADYFQKGAPMSVDDVRTVVFRGANGGYNETQVDVLLDTVIRVMLAVR
jgi:DivIVA domain-containing protein